MRIYITIVVVSILYQIGTFISVDAHDLYNDEDDVLRLKADTFKPTVFSKQGNVTFVVQFYNTFCGHCQMFSPIYKELATRARNWTSVVRIAGIDCSKDENVPICSESKITGYPSIYIYPPNSKSFDNEEDKPLNLRSLNIEWTLDDIEETIISYIGNLTTTRKEHPLVSNAMQPINVSTPDQVKRIYPPNIDFDATNDFKAQQDLLIVVESDKSFLGRKLIIEYFRLHSRLEIRRVLLSNKGLLKSILSTTEYSKLADSQPLLIKINDQNTENRAAQILVRGELSHILPTLEDAERQDFILNRFKMFLEHYYQEELKNAGGYALFREVPPVDKKPIIMDVTRKQNSDMDIYYLVHHSTLASGRVFAVDLLKGIIYMLTHEVKIKGDLSPAEFATVRNMLTILKKFLPLDKWDTTMSKFISDLRTKLDELRMLYEERGITGQEMRDLLELTGADTLRLRYSREIWVSCHDSERQHKGYTCSLWLLFHTLTAGEYNRAAPVRTRPTLVLSTMRDYITKFLGCTVCSSNFEKEAANLESSITARNSSIIWLWKTHNAVNERLNNEKPEDKRKPLMDVIYPSHHRCSECYKDPVSYIGVDGKTLQDIEWKMSAVLETVLETYAPDNVVTPVEMTNMLKSIQGKVNYDLVSAELQSDGVIVKTDMNRSIEQWNLQSIFSASDITICLFLYFCCLIMVGLVCFSLNPKFTVPNGKSK